MGHSTLGELEGVEDSVFRSFAGMVLGFTYGSEGVLARGKFFALEAGFTPAELDGVEDSVFRSFAGMVLGLNMDMEANAALRAASLRESALFWPPTLSFLCS